MVNGIHRAPRKKQNPLDTARTDFIRMCRREDTRESECKGVLRCTAYGERRVAFFPLMVNGHSSSYGLPIGIRVYGVRGLKFS